MTRVDGLVVTAKDGIRPFYPRILLAYVAVLDAGKPPTFVNIGNELVPKVSRQAVQQLFVRHPGLLPWINRHVEAATAHYLGAVVRKAAFMAMQGSDRHMEIYLKHMAGGFARLERGDEAPGAGAILPGAVFNFLVPQPAMPAPPGVTINLPPAALPAPVIPTIDVR